MVSKDLTCVSCDRVGKKYQSEHGKTRVLPYKASITKEAAEARLIGVDEDTATNLLREIDQKPKWIAVQDKCGVPCGGSKDVM